MHEHVIIIIIVIISALVIYYFARGDNELATTFADDAIAVSKISAPIYWHPHLDAVCTNVYTVGNIGPAILTLSNEILTKYDDDPSVTFLNVEMAAKPTGGLRAPILGLGSAAAQLGAPISAIIISPEEQKIAFIMPGETTYLRLAMDSAHRINIASDKFVIPRDRVTIYHLANGAIYTT